MYICLFDFTFSGLLVIMEYKNMLSLVRICSFWLLKFFAGFFKRYKISKQFIYRENSVQILIKSKIF
jgi:hypothetical protein